MFQFRPLPPDVEPGVKVTPTAPEDSTVICETGMSTEAAHEEAGGSLLKGSYDEKTSAESFQDALKEWRNGRNKVAMESKGKRNLFIHFKKGLLSAICSDTLWSVITEMPVANYGNCVNLLKLLTEA